MKRLFILCVILNFFIDAFGGRVVTPGDSIHVEHYAIHLTDIDFSTQEFSAVTTLSLISLSDNLTAIPLELLSLTVDSVFVEGQGIDDYTHQGIDLRIPVTQPAAAGTEYTVQVYYHGHPFHEDWGGFHWSGDYAFNLGVGFVSQPHNLGKAWFPCVDDFTDRALYDIYATVSEDYTVTSGGILLSRVPDGKGMTTWHWQIQHPIPTYLASIAIGTYELYSDNYQGVEREIPVEIFARPSEIDKVEGSFVHLHDVMALFEEKWGPYPFHKIGYSGTAIGAMEHVGNISYPHFAMNGNLTYESLWVHELSHMWFGDATTCHRAEEMWVNEGWGKYNEIFYTETIYGHSTYIDLMEDIHKEVLQYVHTTSGDGGYYALNAVPQHVTYGTTSYEKGALVIHTLRNYMGDTLFFQAAKDYLTTFQYHDATSEELRDAFAASSGLDLTAFFDNWVFTPGTPGYTLQQVTHNEKGEVEVTIEQKMKGREFIGDGNRFDLVFFSESMEEATRTIAFDGAIGSTTYSDLPFTPVAVIPDLYDKMMEATTGEGVIFRTPGMVNFTRAFVKADIVNPAADSIFVYAAHYWVAPESIDPPVEGLTLSDYRYWHIDGVFPETTEGNLHFFYSKANFLDDGIITSMNDSLVLLHRADATMPWAPVSFSQMGPWSVGYLITPLQKGDFTLAVWDEQYVGTKATQKNQQSMLIFPNPAQRQFTFVISDIESAEVEIFESSGRLVFSSACVGNHVMVWDASSCPAGTYTARLTEYGQVVETQKIVKR